MFAPWEDGFDYTPPAPPAGAVAAPPSFVGIGVQKAGTSWWYDLIVDHPDVSTIAGVAKELHFFSRYCTTPFGDRDVEQYHGWFARHPGKAAGEWTPDYLTYPWVPALLRRAAPEARLLVLLRDPIERFQSGLSFRLSQGVPAGEATASDAVRQGFYARGLHRFLDHFAADQVMVLQYEQCVNDPVGQLAATYRFLGLREHQPEGLHRMVNVSAAKRPIDSDARRRLTEVYRDDVDELCSMVPSIDRSLWPNFSALAA
jgi:hypothetical protein